MVCFDILRFYDSRNDATEKFTHYLRIDTTQYNIK